MPTHLPNPDRRAALGIIGGVLAMPRVALAAGGTEDLTGAAFGTRWHLLAAPGSDLAALSPEIDALFAGIDTVLSPWRPDSAISRFNAAPPAVQAADPALIEVTEAALDIARRSAGAFDPTVGPLVARWGFGPIAGGASPDWRAVSAGAGGLGKARADVTLDLCGIAKGWALDRAVARLRSAGLRDLLFDLGGEFFALGQHPDGRDWRVAVEAASPMMPSPAALRVPSGMAVATSGLRAQSYVLNTRRYGHIINPDTREPAKGRLRSVTVVAPQAMTADGWATALFAAGDEAGPDIARSNDIAALFQFDAGSAPRLVRTGPISDLIL